VKPSAIFWPVILQVALTLVVAMRMYMVRIAEIRSRRVNPQSLATSRGMAAHLENVAAADNFRNLFEIPVLFFAICPALYCHGSRNSRPVGTGLDICPASLRAQLHSRHIQSGHASLARVSSQLRMRICHVGGLCWAIVTRRLTTAGGARVIHKLPSSNVSARGAHAER
jgi:hypothetical protein